MAFWGWFLHLKPKFHCAIIYYSVVKSFWHFAQRTTVSLSYLGNFSQWLNAHVPWRYKVSAWNSHHKYYLCNTQISREFLESSRNVSETTPRCVSGAGEEGRGRSWLCWFSVFSSIIHAMSVLGLLTGCSNGLAVGAILKRMLYRLYGLCVGLRCVSWLA